MTSINQEKPILTVTQLTNAIKNQLEKSFPTIWLQGEISNCKLHTSGHLYFSLKDENAQISAVMFRAKSTLGDKIPKDGDRVIVHGALNVYPTSGRYQIVVHELKFTGLGELLLKLEELKQKLLKKGYFSKTNKKPLPKFPKKIGVVTSPTGAAIQDMLKILTRRMHAFHMILNPVKVQGAGASVEIAQAINDFNKFKMVDVIIVGRGGGSIEDLWAFNEEVVADAIFQSKIPIIAAIGHETDHTIAEYVADQRAPTPTGAAEIVTAVREQMIEKLVFSRKNCDRNLKHLLNNYKQILAGFKKQPMFSSPWTILGSWMQKLDDSRQTLEFSVKQIINQKKQKIESYQKLHASLKPTNQIINLKKRLNILRVQIDSMTLRLISLMKERLQSTENSLKSIDPKNLLKNGYTILFSLKDKSVINTVQKIKKEKEFRILLSDGEVISKVKEKFDD